MSSALTVWYNTKCPVCNAGIEWQRRRLARAARAGVIEFRDINLEPAASLDLANVYSDRRLAKSDAEYGTNLQFALRLQLSALHFFSKSNDPTAWGILQHNLGCSYIDLSNTRSDESKSAGDIENAIHHLELSFEVRDPENGLQYWVASCRSLGEALLNMSTYSTMKDAADYVRRASEVLNRAAAKICSSEHPHQWAEIRTQLARCGERRHP